MDKKIQELAAKAAKYDALHNRVEKLSEKLDEAGDDYGLELFGEMLLSEFGYL